MSQAPVRCLGWPSRAVGLEPSADGCRVFSCRRRALRTADAAGRGAELRARGPDFRAAVAGDRRHALPHGLLRLAAVELARQPVGRAGRVGADLAALSGRRDLDHELLSRTRGCRSRGRRLPRARSAAPAARRRDRLDNAAVDLADVRAQPFGASGLSAGARDKSLSLSRPERISFRAGVFRSGRAQTARYGGSQASAQPVRRPHFPGWGRDCRAVRPAARQSRRAGDRHRLYVAYLRGAAAPRIRTLWAASPDPVWRCSHPSTMSIGCSIHV